MLTPWYRVYVRTLRPEKLGKGQSMLDSLLSVLAVTIIVYIIAASLH